MKVLLKEPKQEPKLIDIELDNQNINLRKALALEDDQTLGYATLASGPNILFIVYHDDRGIYSHEVLGKPYNCNIPSNGKFQNQIFGNLIIQKSQISPEKDLDLTEEEFKKLASIFFEVPEEEWYTQKDVERFWKGIL